MQIVKIILGWIARHFVLWVLLIGAILVWNSWQQGTDKARRAERLEQVLATLDRERETGEAALRQAEADARGRSVEALAAMLADARDERRALVGSRRPDLQRKTSIVLADSKAVLADQMLELRIAVAGRKIAGLERSIAATEAQLDSAAMIAAANRAYRDADLRAKAVRAACDGATAAVDRFESRGAFGRWLGDLTGEGRRLRDARDRQCDSATALADRAGRVKDILARTRQGGIAAARAGAWSHDRLETGDAAIRAALARERAGAEGSARGTVQRKWTEWGMAAIVWQAFAALLFIVATPYLIRLLFYYVLAPIAERRAAIRIAVPGGIRAAMPPADPSCTSVPVKLGKGEELLVRQDYLQSTSVRGTKDTRWLLDPHHPFSSIASGLWFLTRIRDDDRAESDGSTAADGGITTISAVHDPFAEVTLVTLPDGGAAVLQPRALAAVVHRAGMPMRVTSHWRLFSLNAWLTLQLRYLVFHGPARLVIKGGRGIRVERAGAGRIFGQDQLVGFSADLAYSVTRTETFWPYFLGREQLLKDRVLEGDGMLMIEEAPLAGRRGRGARGGLEGAFDAVLKAVGL